MLLLSLRGSLKALALSLFPLFFLACAPKPSLLLSSDPKLILLATPGFRFNDTGFVKHYNDKISVEIYSIGQVMLVLEIRSDSICLNGECHSKARVNEEIFGSKVAYETLLEEVIEGKDIFKGEGKLTEQGLIRQHLVSPDYDIVYERSLKGTLFRDRINKTALMIKEL